MNYQKVVIVGRLTADPVLKNTQGGNPVTNFSVATTRTWNGKTGGKQEETEFHNVVAWGRTAEIVSQYVGKGDILLVEGYLKTRKWEDKQGGKRSTTEIVAERVQLGPKRGNATAAPAGEPTDEVPVEDLTEAPAGDELPF
jgi:single-strand DNA-binding protein